MDTAPVQVTVMDAAGNADALATLFRSWSIDWSMPVSVTAITVAGMQGRSVTFTDDAGPLGVLATIAPALEALGVTYVGDQDPKFEFPGDYVAFAPELGRFTGVSAPGPAVMASALDKAVDALRASGADAQSILDAVDRLSGRPWRDALAIRSKAPH